MVEVKNRGCQTNAVKADFFVNSQGEMNRFGVGLPCSSLNLTDVCNEYGLDWDVVCHLKHNDRSALNKRWKATQEEAWERQYRAELSRREYNFMRLVLSFQAVVDFGRFRVYGEIRRGHPRIVVCTEFAQAVENDKFWTDFNKMVRELDCGVWIMSEEKLNDHSYRTTGAPFYTKIEGSDQYGPNHGKVERQVECSWRIERLTPVELKELVKLLRRKTQKLWKQSGVGVC